MTTYTYNTTIRITGTFAVSDVATDPTTVTLKTKSPSGAVSTYTYALSQVTKSATGVYYKDVQLTEAGTWQYRWSGTGAVASEDWSTLEVEPEWVRYVPGV